MTHVSQLMPVLEQFPVELTKVSTGRRNKRKLGIEDFSTGLRIARRLFQEHRYPECFDLYEQLAAKNREQSIDLLAELYDLYQSLPEKEDRYTLYQARLFDFGIGPSDKVLDIGSGNIPFQFATHLADLSPEDDYYGRAGAPFKHVQGKPVHTCNIEDMREFADKEFDFVYCSHVLEHVKSPESACRELTRIGRRGYIETPTRGKDLWLSTAKVSNHLWAVEYLHQKLIFTEYTPEEAEGFQCDLLMKMHLAPQSKREKALTALIYLKADLVNTMFVWENSFEYEVRRVRHWTNPCRADLEPETGLAGSRTIPDNRATDFGSIATGSGASQEVHRLQKKAPQRPIGNQGVCLFLNTYYSRFLEEHYARNPDLASASYSAQKASIQGRFFGDCDFYSRALQIAGWAAEDLIVNCDPLQRAWARENCPEMRAKTSLQIAVEQIRLVQPQMVYLQDLNLATSEFLSAVRPHATLIAGQIASPLPQGIDLRGLDIIISSFPHFVDRFRSQGKTAYYQPLAFEPRVLENLPVCERKLPVTFVGGLSSAHGRGNTFLQRISELVPIDFWGYGVDCLPMESAIRKRHQGEAWGLDMFLLLHRSRITINRHIDVAENFANNMRLFEATGCGALLITDYKDNLEELFEIGKEVVAYRSPEECAALIKYYLDRPVEAQQIARAGQARTLREHSYQNRMAQTAEFVERHLRRRTESQGFSLPDAKTISYGHTPIQKSQITDSLVAAWKAPEIPLKQRALVQRELGEMYQGRIPVIFQVLSDCLRPAICSGSTLLEVGCASGYYYEVLQYLLMKQIDFTGVDYSEALIQMARDYYPRARFEVADGASLPFGNGSFLAVVSSGVLLHTPNYQAHIAEAARVAKEYVVAHRTPVCRQRETQYLKKYGYGVEMVELLFSEREILSHFTAQGLKLLRQVEYDSDPAHDAYGVTYLFKKSTGPAL
jgi:ubiquinone/menaquinone biosynthesis C-methylase UbiE